MLNCLDAFIDAVSDLLMDKLDISQSEVNEITELEKAKEIIYKSFGNWISPEETVKILLNQ